MVKKYLTYINSHFEKSKELSLKNVNMISVVEIVPRESFRPALIMHNTSDDSDENHPCVRH